MRVKLLVITDTHYVGGSDGLPHEGARKCALGLELVRRVLRRARRQERPDAIVLLGDLIDNGDAPRAEDDLAELARVVHEPGIPVIVVPGNHDRDPERYLRVFGQSSDVLALGEWRLVAFTDRYAPGDHAAREAAGLERLASIHRAEPGARIVALQHNPVHPRIGGEYPYNLTNSAEVMRAYSECGVALSLSGHYHPGIAPQEVDGVRYAIAPALCEGPFRYLTVTLDGDSVDIREERLSFEPSWGLVDVHCHTHFSYCCRGYDAAGAVERCRLMGLAKVYLTEHAGQLYVPPDDFWSARFQWEPEMLRQARDEGRDRVAQWKSEQASLLAPDVALGLEMECHPDGTLAVLPEDLEGVGVRIGAVHWLPCILSKEATPERLRAEFLAQTEGLLRAGVDVLAHPFRIFPRNGYEQPEGVEEAVLDLLAETGAAAEINYHQNEPTARFFTQCRERGIPIVLGTDSHTPEEVGDLSAHVALLREIGAELPGAVAEPGAGA